MKLLFQLSLRNLLRHKRRNGMLLAAIAVAVAGVNATNTLLRGYQYDMLDSALNNMTGHIKVYAPGYRDDPSVQKGFVLSPEYVPQVPPKELLGWARRIRVPAVIMSERETRGVQLVGIEPGAEGISFIGEVGVDGEFLADGNDKRVLVGRELARQLGTRVGRRLVIIAQGADGRNRERGYRIAGIYDAEGTALEKAFVFVGLEHLQNLLDADVVTELSVRLVDETAEQSVKSKMAETFTEMDVFDWQELEPQIAEMFKFADATIYIWFVLLMSALTFGLVNSLIAAVMERVKELGMLRALGMQKRTVVLQVVIESTIIMVVGIILGTLMSFALYAWIQDGIDLSAWAEGAEMAGISANLVPLMMPKDVIEVAWMSLVLGFLASLYPAWRVVRIRPLDALRG